MHLFLFHGHWWKCLFCAQSVHECCGLVGQKPGYPHLCKGMHENKNKGKKGCTCLFLDMSCQCVSVMARGLSTLIVIISVFALFHRSLDVLSIQYRTIYFRVILLYLFFTLAQTVSGRNLKHDLCKSYASF